MITQSLIESRMSKQEKVIIVSLHKTGTTSVALFLEKLGYLVTGPDTNLYYDSMKGDYATIDYFLKKYDAFQDDPWYKIYPYIKEKYSSAKFVFLERSPSSWLESVQAFYGADRYNNKVRHDFYGATIARLGTYHVIFSGLNAANQRNKNRSN